MIFAISTETIKWEEDNFSTSDIISNKCLHLKVKWSRKKLYLYFLKNELSQHEYDCEMKNLKYIRHFSVK